MMVQGEKVDPGGPGSDMETDQPVVKDIKSDLPSADELRLDLDHLDEEDEDREARVDDARRRDGSGSGGSTLRLDDIDSEEDIPPPEMTQEEKQMMVDCVRRGDIEEFEELLDTPGADINMIWFSENLLMTAVRWKREEMALYLIDNGVSVLFETTRLQKYEDPNDPKKTVLRWYSVSCRQVAYDNGIQNVVDAIDLESGELLMHTPTERTKKFWKPREERELEKLRATREDLSDFSSITAPDLLWEDDGAMADTEVTNSTVNSPRARPQTPSDGSETMRSEGLAVETRVLMDVQPGEGEQLRQSAKHKTSVSKVDKDINGDSVEMINRKISRESLRNKPVPKVVVEDRGSDVTLKSVNVERAYDNGGQTSADNDVMPCHSRGACTDDGVYGNRSPFSHAYVQNRVKSAGVMRIGGTRTDVYRKRDSRRKIMLRQNQNGADFIKPVMANGSYPVESKRWAVGDTEKAQTPRDTGTPVNTRRICPSSPRMTSANTNDVFIKPASATSSHPSSKYTKHNDSLDTFPSIGTKTTRLQHKQTYLMDVGGRKGWDKK